MYCNRPNPRRTRQGIGFTFIEIMIVVVIIGILAGAVTLSASTHYLDKAKQSRARSDIATYCALPWWRFMERTDVILPVMKAWQRWCQSSWIKFVWTLGVDLMPTTSLDATVHMRSSVMVPMVGRAAMGWMLISPVSMLTFRRKSKMMTRFSSRLSPSVPTDFIGHGATGSVSLPCFKHSIIGGSRLGFTLIEVLVVVLITAILVGAVSLTLNAQ